MARLLGLAYPGGPAISRAAADGDPGAVAFPRPLTGPGAPPLGFSFAGLKTAVARYVERGLRPGVGVADIAASFQEAVADTLSAKAILACRQQRCDTLVTVGGVAANSRIRALLRERCDAAGIELRIPPPRLCTDNGAMIAAVGDLLVRAGEPPSPPSLAAMRQLCSRERGLTEPPGMLTAWGHLLVGTPYDEPWHLAAHLDDGARYAQLPELSLLWYGTGYQRVRHRGY